VVIFPGLNSPNQVEMFRTLLIIVFFCFCFCPNCFPLGRLSPCKVATPLWLILVVGCREVAYGNSEQDSAVAVDRLMTKYYTFVSEPPPSSFEALLCDWRTVVQSHSSGPHCFDSRRAPPGSQNSASVSSLCSSNLSCQLCGRWTI